MKWEESDRATLLRRIDNKLGEKAVRRQKYNLTTNRCEAAHVTILKSVPKRHAFAKTFKGRAHSACHSISVGETVSQIIANKLLGAPNTTCGKVYRNRLGLIKREIYYRDRRRSKSYKEGVKRLRVLKKRACYHPSGNSGSYSTGCNDPVVNLDHPYDMK